MTLDDDIALLQRAPLFSAIERDALRLLAFSAETRQLRAGDVLFRKGDRSDCGYVVASGVIALTREGEEEPAYLAGPASLIGELALISETKRPVTATASEAATVLRISRAMFKRTLEEYPQAAQRLGLQLRQRIRDISGELARVRTKLQGEP